MVKPFLVAVTAATFLSCMVGAQEAKAFLGRWDMTVTPASGTPYPQWMELLEKDGKIEGRVQPRGGGWRPILGAGVESGKMIVTVSAGRGPAINWELTSPAPNKLSGVEKRGDSAGPMLAGVRAPKLDRPMPGSWATPQPLFNGKDLTGWEPIGNVKNNKWIARDGELINDNPQVDGPRGPGAANLKSTAKFQDFKLHIEVNCPGHGNSGIYLRGRYEIQVGTEGGSQPDHEMGAVYSHYPPPAGSELGLDRWTSFDITFVGRKVTVLRDGKVYHD
ncbi:MAG: DUF1080 domain-containing protein, partial [Bryobacteraceae bacterium]|nr:DUF1080 domain-containing protein [Bryobacteraceae bacterium]